MPNATSATHKILLIEDDEQLQQSYQKLFTAEGFQVFQGFTGDQGLQLAKQERPDIILLDIMLKGGVNGFDVLERLKKDRDLFNIPVLMLTNLDSERKLALSIGAVDYLVKANTSIDLLLEKVKNYIGQSLTTFAEDTSQFGGSTPDAAPPMTTPSPATSPAVPVVSPPVPPSDPTAMTAMPVASTPPSAPPAPVAAPTTPPPVTPPVPAAVVPPATITPPVPAASTEVASPASAPVVTTPTPVTPIGPPPPMTTASSDQSSTSATQPLPEKSPMTL